jgi:group I intron endonuclease
MFRTIFIVYRFIYKTTCLINGKIYVGQHKTKNLNDGYIGNGIRKQSDANNKSLFHRAVRKYGYKNFKLEIIEDSILNKKRLNEQEVYWITELDARNREIGYNVGRGGGGSNLEYHTESTKAQMSISQTGRHHTEETKQKGRERMLSLGEKNPAKRPEVRKKNSDAHLGLLVGDKNGMFGKHHKQESIDKQKATLAAKPILICPYCGFLSRNKGAITQHHFDNCKHNPNRNIKSIKTKTG